MNASRTCLAAIVAAAAALGVVHTQDGEPTFRSWSDLVVVPANVTDRSGRFVKDLKADDFQLLEDGVRRPIARFASERVPISLAVVLDVSGSMARTDDRWALTRRAVASFVAQLKDDDELTFFVFNQTPTRLGGWTRNFPAALRELAGITPGGDTELFRAVSAAALTFADASNNRKVLVLVTDGNTRELDAERMQAIERLRRSDAVLYAIGIGMGGEPVNTRTLDPLTKPTGGYVELVKDGMTLQAAAMRVADDLREQYILAFEPAALDRKFHKIILKPRIDDYRIRTRAGYMALPPKRPQ
jgi:Ca-activated chloride channel family protein